CFSGSVFPAEFFRQSFSGRVFPAEFFRQSFSGSVFRQCFSGSYLIEIIQNSSFQVSQSET
ncbi:MAG: hypothetical protein IKI22_00645, partial [Neisseriaceae bacterium]|nr:hypothetical protein [Neisseriaceae bacterium]